MGKKRKLSLAASPSQPSIRQFFQGAEVPPRSPQPSIVKPVGAGLKAEAQVPTAGSTSHVGEHINAPPAEEKPAAGSAVELNTEGCSSRKPTACIIGRRSGKVSINIVSFWFHFTFRGMTMVLL